jgi:hypothetical protein
MPTILIIPLLGYCIYLLALTIVNESAGVWLFGVLVLVLTKRLCKATNWMDKETEEKE